MLVKFLILLLIATKINGDDYIKKCNNGLGECVPYYLCRNEKINIDGSSLLDGRSKRETFEENECIDYFEKCCAIDNVIPIVSQTPTKQPGELSISESCGWRNPEGIGFRITGNNDGEAEYGEFPWMAAVLQKIPNNETSKIYKCGGGLIAPNVILTAADCIKNLSTSDLIVRLGEWDIQTKNELFPHVDYAAIDTITHENFNSTNLQNDIALLFLNDSVPFAEHIQTICLPPQNQNFDGKDCIVSGWGKDVYGKKGKYQAILKKIELSTVPFDECQKALRKTRLERRFQLHEGFLCAGGEKDKDACTGDGGSPLICPIDGMPGRYFQAGIVSWGIGCGEIKTPGVYTNVAHYRSWIDEKIASKKGDETCFCDITCRDKCNDE